MKVCKGCGVPKELSEFGNEPRTKDGKKGKCLLCAKAYSAKWYQNNKETVIAKVAKRYYSTPVPVRQAIRRTRYESNREHELAAMKRYKDNLPEVIRKRGTIQPAKTKEAHKVYKQYWRRANKDKVNYSTAKRRAAKLKAMPAWADDWKIQQYYILAAKLTERYGEQFHVDHIIPLNGVRVSGLHVQGNLQIITQKENLMKYNKFS
jgi:5-methylcytosine-specific restriction endonuclease McrA